ncbi:MAG: release factor glutamine methyltransferase [Rhodothermales bacterium]
MPDRSNRSFKSLLKTPDVRKDDAETVDQARKRLRATLAGAGIGSAALEADWLLESALGVSRAALMTNGSRTLLPKETELLREWSLRRAGREPLQYILGETGFYGRLFRVAPGALIPRPETEHLVEAALQFLPKSGRVLEVGVGSGCIACTIALERPDADVWAVDISEAALVQARDNAARLGARVACSRQDVFATWSPEPGPLDLLISNPPYVPDQDEEALEPELKHEPSEALFLRGETLRFVRRLAEIGRRFLAPGGRLMIETHSPDAKLGAQELVRLGYGGVHIIDDLAGLPRVLVGTH